MSGSGDIPLGRRVVVRYRLPEGSEYRFTDVIGALISDEPITVRTDNDVTVTVDAADLVAIKAVGPRPIRIGDIRALESAAIDGWPGLERARYDGWLCSAGNGYSGRANSAVPLGDSGHNAGCDADTLHVIGEWYTSQGLPLQVRVPDRLAPIPEDWRVWGETLVLGVDIRTVVLPQGPSMVRIDDQPDDAWLELHHQRGEDTVAVAAPKPDVAVLTAVRDGEIGFASLGLPTPLAIGRAAITTGTDRRRWLGLSCVAVASPHRRHGLGTLICAELLRWGRRFDATHAYAQVEIDNDGALEMFRQLGFIDHHRYRYAAPGPA